MTHRISVYSPDLGKITIDASTAKSASVAAERIMQSSGGDADAPPPAIRFKPFNLELAKKGAAITTRDGRQARFIAHVPDADERSRVLVMIEGINIPAPFTENGNYGVVSDGTDPSSDLCMAPLPTRVEWVNLYADGTYARFTNEEAAHNAASESKSQALIEAMPAQFDDPDAATVRGN